MAVLRELSIRSANGPPILDEDRPPRARGRAASPEKCTANFSGAGTRAGDLAARSLETFQPEVSGGIQAFRLRKAECPKRWHRVANRARKFRQLQSRRWRREGHFGERY